MRLPKLEHDRACRCKACLPTKETMSYTHYKLDDDAPLLEVIHKFEKLREIQLTELQAEVDFYKAEGYALNGGNHTLLGLQFRPGEEPEGWTNPAALRKHTRLTDDFSELRLYRITGNNKPARRQRKRWANLKLASAREFTQLLPDLPAGVKGWGFQTGLTWRQAMFEKVESGYMLLVPLCEGKQTYTPEKVRELLRSEYIELGGTH